MAIFKNLIWQSANFALYTNFTGSGEERFDARREGEHIASLATEIFMKKTRGRLLSADVAVFFPQSND